VREIVESTLISLDGVANDPGSWALDYFDEQFLTEAHALLAGCDALLLGRGTYEDLSWRWPGRRGDFADAINGIRKYVFSSTLERADWNNSVIVRGGVADEVRALKEGGEGDLVVFGHGRLSRTLLEHGLLDRLRLAVHPIVVGDPLGPFPVARRTRLSLVGIHSRRSGVVVLDYRVDRD
jgi:dihydrofolate reductase